MQKILVTGATGDLGRKTVLHLLNRKPASEIAALVRDPSKAADLEALGVELRRGDYMDRSSLQRAFDGVEKLMLTATHAFTDRNTAHANVIEEAARAGVGHVVFMPIHRKVGSTFTMAEITTEDIFTVNKLRSSGVAYTLAEHPPFLDILAFYIGANAHETGVRVPSGNGKFAAATRDDLAEAHASILAGKGHENKTYCLTGAPAISFADIADILSKVTGKHVPYEQITDEEFRESKRPTGFPEPVIEFALRWVQGMNAGEWQEQTQDLEMLIGRQPKTSFEFFRDEFFKPQSPLTTIQ